MPVASVHAAIPPILEKMNLTVTEQSFDGATGYVSATTPAGARVQIYFETITPEQTFFQVSATRLYRNDLTDRVVELLYEVINGAG